MALVGVRKMTPMKRGLLLPEDYAIAAELVEVRKMTPMKRGLLLKKNDKVGDKKVGSER